MNDRERALIRLRYELQLELHKHRGEEIEALRRANKSLRRSHEVIGKMLKATGEIMSGME
jgi:hypothetical protein